MTYTINPNAKNVWIRDNEDTMDLSPITDAGSVYLENGRTLEQELGEGSMVSNVATVDNSMTKVIDGTLDGAYESGVLYGRSLVNLVSQTSLENSHFTDYTLSYIDKTRTYLIKYESSKPISNIGFIVDNTTWNKRVDITETKTNGYVTIKPNESLDVTNLRVVTSNSIDSYTLKIMLLEYQEGMENWDIPYFEGICDVKMPILRNVGKNLLELNDTVLVKTAGTNNLPLTKKNGGLLAKKDSCVKGSAVIYIEIPNAVKGRKYQFSATITSTNMNRALSFYGGNTAYSLLVNNNGRGDGSRVVSDICTFNPSWDKFCIVIGDHGTLTEGANISIEISDLCVWEVDTKQTSMPYEDHKTNILHTPEEVVLRSLPNGVCDTLDLMTGEYVQRIGEVVLDGSEDESYSELSVNENSYTVWTHFPIPAKAFGKTINNKCFINEWWEKESNSCGIDHNGSLIVTIKKELLSTTSTEALKKYLKQNPITVQYELETPVTTKVVLTQSEPIVKIGTELPNGVCDTYNLLTGEHIQRVGKVVLDGSEAWTKVAFPSTNTTHCYSSLKIENLKMPNVNEKNIVSDRFQTVPQESYNYSNEEMYTWRAGELLYVNILRSRLSTSDVQGLKAWFKENPTTVWYELKNPIVTKKNGLPNTHGVTLPNGVRDKYNESTGVYTQNIGRTTFDGSEDWRQNQEGSYGFYCYHNESKDSSSFNCKELDAITGWNDYTQKGIFKGSVAWGVVVKSTDLTSCTVEAFKAWLKQNPITVEYEMVTPKTVDITPINVGQVLPNGVCDTYNPITKEYVKRVSGTVLVGNEDWSLMNSPYETDCIGFVTPCSLANWTQSQANLNIVCEGYVGNYELWNVDEEGFSVFKTPTRLAIKVKRSKLSTADINGFKKFLKLNPLAVWYELATPEVSTVDLDLSTLYSSSPVAYENGHIILESGHDGQSLLPTLEYSTVTNRVKQIENIGEQVLRQEKQLTMLEQMLIKGIIGIDYNNTVLTLNLEIDEVI